MLLEMIRTWSRRGENSKINAMVKNLSHKNWHVKGVKPKWRVHSRGEPRTPILQQLNAVESVKTIFQQQLVEIEKNEQGIRENIDPEYLHNFRVAIRRTRVLLTQSNGILAQRSRNKYARDFARLGGSTGAARDMDVYLLFYKSLKSSLPAKKRKDIAPLFDYLLRHKQLEHTKLIKMLDSAHYRNLKADWRKIISAPRPAHSSLANAECPTISYASRRIWRIYRKAIQRGGLIKKNTPADALHRLRKTCKKLRYMSEFFRSHYPQHKIKPLIKSLRNLQNNLGEFQDCMVQKISLRHFISGMESETGISSETRRAINYLVAKIDAKERRVRAEFAGRWAKFASARNRKRYKKLFAHPVANPATGQTVP